MMVSVLVSAATMESEIAHQGMFRSARKYALRDRSFARNRRPKSVTPIRYAMTMTKSSVCKQGSGAPFLGNYIVCRSSQVRERNLDLEPRSSPGRVVGYPIIQSKIVEDKIVSLYNALAASQIGATVI